MEEIQFIVNGENMTLTFQNDDFTIQKLKSDDDFAVHYIEELINNGFISLLEPLSTISRIYDDEEILIYSNAINEQEVEVEKENINAKAEWSENETKYLLDLYQENIVRVGPMKRFKKKKCMWDHLAQKINEKFNVNRTGLQVENRYKTILKRKKVAVDNNASSGALRQRVPYEEEFKKICALDDSIEPEVIGNASGIKILKGTEDDSLPSTSSSKPNIKKRKTESLVETLKKLQKEKEEGRERRHLEKMNLIRELLQK